MKNVQVDYTHVLDFLKEDDIFGLQKEVDRAHSIVEERSGAGSDFLGWLDLASRTSAEEVDRIAKLGEEIRKTSDILVVIGIGGSYLGAKAVIDAMAHSFHNALPYKIPQVVFAGQNMSGKYYEDLKELLQNKRVFVNVISKSGTTTEPALGLRLLREHLEATMSREQAGRRIVATTDAKRGSLKTMADSEGYRTFVIPDDVGGRYSVLTPVGLIPIAAAGVDIQQLLKGARDMEELLKNADLRKNPAYVYAAIRYLMYTKGKAIEILANFDPSLHYISEWWKQLYGESEGKDHKSLFPASVDFSTDLHSMGQWIQQGTRNIFETFLWIDSERSKTAVPKLAQDADGFNFLAGRTLDFVNRMASEGVALAHRDGEVPNLTVRLPELSAYYLGQMIYFFEKACAVSGYMIGVNPFDQPGVETYKTNMFALLGKKGFETQTKSINERISKIQRKAV